MKIVSAAYLVDTNVLVYAYDPAEDAKRSRSQDLLKRIALAGTGALIEGVRFQNPFGAMFPIARL